MSDSPSQVLEATETFICDLRGETLVVEAHLTRVAADHPLATTYPGRFRPIEDHLTYRVEDMTAEPGRPRARKISKPSVEPEAKEAEVRPHPKPQAASEPVAKRAEPPAPVQGLTTRTIAPKEAK